MINFLKYVGCLLADLFGVALISEMLIRPIIYGTLGKEYHYVYMLITYIDSSDVRVLLRQDEYRFKIHLPRFQKPHRTLLSLHY